MTHTVTLLPGDGIGPEVARAAVAIIAASGAKIEWQEMEAGADVMTKYGTAVPDEVINAIQRNSQQGHVQCPLLYQDTEISAPVYCSRI